MGGGVAADFLRRLQVRTFASLFVALLDGSEGPAVLGDPLECEPRLSDGVSRQDESEGPDVLCDPLECEPRLGDGEDVDSLGDDLENANGTAVAD